MIGPYGALRAPGEHGETNEEAVAAPDFGTVPALIREHGRARGFERLRDLVLERPDGMGTDNFLAVLKMVIELDRHALFSEVSEAKARDRMDKDAWEKFQEYLRGDDVTADPQEKPKKAGKKRGQKVQRAEKRAPLRETDGVLGVLRGNVGVDDHHTPA